MNNRPSNNTMNNGISPFSLTPDWSKMIRFDANGKVIGFTNIDVNALSKIAPNMTELMGKQTMPLDTAQVKQSFQYPTAKIPYFNIQLPKLEMMKKVMPDYNQLYSLTKEKNKSPFSLYFDAVEKMKTYNPFWIKTVFPNTETNSKNHSTQKKPIESILPYWTRPAVQVGLTAFGVATAVYPFEIIQARVQTGLKNIGNNMNVVPAYSSHVSFWRGFMNSILKSPVFVGYTSAMKASTLKNAALSQNQQIRSMIETTIRDTQVLEGGEIISESTLRKLKMQSTVATAVVLGTFDTSLTNYYAGLKVWGSVGYSPILALPEKFKLWRTGFHLRGTKNTANALICIAMMTIMHEPILAKLPEEDYGKTATIVTTFLAGILGGLSTNAIEVIYKNKLSMWGHEMVLANKGPKEISPPSIHKVVTHLWKNKGGPYAFTRGAGHSVVISTIAYGMIHLVNDFVAKLYNEEPHKHHKKHIKMMEQDSAENKAIEQPKSTTPPIPTANQAPKANDQQLVVYTNKQGGQNPTLFGGSGNRTTENKGSTQNKMASTTTSVNDNKTESPSNSLKK